MNQVSLKDFEQLKLRKAEFKKDQLGSDTKDREESKTLKRRRSLIIILLKN